jgi:magnesium transporter
MIAGIYGMNFEFMPELHWPYSYPAFVAAMAAACGVLYRRFRQAGWL